jgi:hypothetical protein
MCAGLGPGAENDNHGLDGILNLDETEVRFLDEAGQPILTPELLVEIAGEIKVFADWFVETLLGIARRRRQSVNL